MAGSEDCTTKTTEGWILNSLIPLLSGVELYLISKSSGAAAKFMYVLN